jgi:uncharacterized membrane protein (TIGR02234 family)
MTTAGRDRRGLVIAVLAAVAGAGLALFALSRTWVVLIENRPAPMAPLRQPRTGGALLPWLPALGLVGLAGAGALVATRRAGRIAVGGLLVLCGLGLLAGAGYAIWAGDAIWAGGTVGAGDAVGVNDTSGTGDAIRAGGPLGCVVGGLLLLGAGGLAIRRGHAWPALGARYARPAARGAAATPGKSAPGEGTPGEGTIGRSTIGRSTIGESTIGDPGPDPAGIWDALDRGEDPTAG